MRFRILFGYVLLEAGALMLVSPLAILTFRWGSFEQLLIGIVLGTILGSFYSSIAWRKIVFQLARNSSMTPADAQTIFGPGWFFTVQGLNALVLLIFPFEENYRLLLLINTILAGVITGSEGVYFLILAIRTLLKEWRTGQKIVIRFG